eukprot:761351-Hanusia_phi.AAC.1
MSKSAPPSTRSVPVPVLKIVVLRVGTCSLIRDTVAFETSFVVLLPLDRLQQQQERLEREGHCRPLIDRVLRHSYPRTATACQGPLSTLYTRTPPRSLRAPWTSTLAAAAALPAHPPASAPSGSPGSPPDPPPEAWRTGRQSPASAEASGRSGAALGRRPACWASGAGQRLGIGGTSAR